MTTLEGDVSVQPTKINLQKRMLGPACLALMLSAATAVGQDLVEEPLPDFTFGEAVESASNEAPLIDWEIGPVVSEVGTEAKIAVPEGYLFSGPEGARTFLQLTENIPGDEIGVLVPSSEEEDWFVLFSFDPVGYVKDDEQDSLDADDLLASIRESNESGNQERQRMGWGTLTITGWIQPPHYDESTNNLEWSLRVEDESGDPSANHQTRYLGRRGVMRVELVAQPEDLDTALAAFHEAMTGFSFTSGNDYSSFVEGDKIAEYGLTALVLGGAGAAAAKAGLFKVLGKLLVAGWKLLALAVAAIAGFLKRLFSPRKPGLEPGS